jgi:protein-disulfide isomerase
MRLRLILGLCLTAAPAVAQTATAPLESRTKGAPAAPVTVYEMSDFQCPYCRRFAHETFPALERSYIAPGKVRWVFINFPLTDIHPHAAAAAQLALCGAKQKSFWRIHDLLFQYQESWAPLKEAGPFFVSLADSAGLSKPAMLACLEAPETMQAVQADAEGAARSGASSTPTFYIEGALLEGALPLAVFQHVLDSVYAVKTGRAATAAPSRMRAQTQR